MQILGPLGFSWSPGGGGLYFNKHSGGFPVDCPAEEPWSADSSPACLRQHSQIWLWLCCSLAREVAAALSVNIPCISRLAPHSRTSCLPQPGRKTPSSPRSPETSASQATARSFLVSDGSCNCAFQFSFRSLTVPHTWALPPFLDGKLLEGCSMS